MTYNFDVVAERLRKAFDDSGLTLAQVAEHCGVQQYQTISNWNKGNTIPSLDNMLKLCDLYCCELGYLLGEFEGKTRTATDVHDYMSLSYEAIERIHTSKTVSSVLNLLFDSKDKEGRCLIDVIGEYLKFNVNQDAFISESGDLFPRERSNLSELEKELNPGFYLSKDAFTELYLVEIRDWLKHIRETNNTELK